MAEENEGKRSPSGVDVSSGASLQYEARDRGVDNEQIELPTGDGETSPLVNNLELQNFTDGREEDVEQNLSSLANRIQNDEISEDVFEYLDVVEFTDSEGVTDGGDGDAAFIERDPDGEPDQEKFNELFQEYGGDIPPNELMKALPEKPRIVLAENSNKTSLDHEFMHATLRNYGHGIDDSVNRFSQKFNGVYPRHSFDGKSKQDIFRESVEEGYDEHPEFRSALNESDEYDSVDEYIEENIDDIPDEPVQREQFHLKQRDSSTDAPEEITRLAEKTNEVWDDIIDDIQAGDVDSAKTKTIDRDPYKVSNAEELLTGLQEVMQSDGQQALEAKKVKEHYPEWVDAYTDVFEPSQTAKDSMSFLE